MNLSELLSQIKVFQNPRDYSKEQFDQALVYCNTLKSQTGNLNQFFLCFENVASQPNSLHFQFWFLSAISEMIPKNQSCKQVQETFFRLLKNESLVFSNKAISNKFALIFVRLVSKDFPDFWPDVFDKLFNLVNSEPHKMNLIKFIVQCLQTLHQELIEKGEQKTPDEIAISTRVKNGIRNGPILLIIQNLGSLILQNYTQFEPKVVQSTLEIFAQLIDWNELSHFESMVQSCIQLLQNPQAAQMRNGAFNCVQAVVTKGMDHQLKLDMVQNINFIGIVQHFQMVNKDLSIDNAEDDEVKDEEEFFHLIASSISKLGEWCLNVLSEGFKFTQPERFELVFQSLIENALRLLDTSNPRIAMPLIEFFTLYLRHNQKACIPNPNIELLTTILVHRLQYPSWFLEMRGHTSDPDDWSDGRLDEQRFMRENQLTLLSRICQFKPMEGNFLEAIKNAIEKVDPNSDHFTQMEVPLQMMITLACTLVSDQKNKEPQIDHYRFLLQLVFEKDMLNSWPVVHRHLLTLQQYQEMIYRSSFFYKGEQLCQLLLSVYFNLMGNSCVPVVHTACQNVKRICEKNTHIVSQTVYFQQMIQRGFEAIEKLQKQQEDENFECLVSLYGFMGQSAQNSKEIDVIITQKVKDNLLMQLRNSKNLQDAKGLIENVRLIVEFSKGFTTKVVKKEVKECFEEILQEIILLIQMPGKIVGLQEHLTKYIERQITIMGADTKNLIFEVAQLQLGQTKTDGNLEKLEGLLQLLNNYVGQIKKDSLELIEHLFSPIFETIALIETPVTNTSEVQKIQIKAIYEFCRLISKVLSDYKCHILLSPKNVGNLRNFMNFLFHNYFKIVDVNTKRCILTALRALQLGLNESATQDTIYFNQNLISMSCEQLFTQNVTNFDGTNFVKKSAEFHAACADKEFLRGKMAKVMPNQEVVNEMLRLCQQYNEKKIKVQELGNGYVKIVKQIQNVQ